MINRLDSVGAGALRAAAEFIADALTFPPLREVNSFNGGTVKERVMAIWRFNKAKALLCNLLDCTVCHFITLILYRSVAVTGRRTSHA
jgi:hypothetical protein